MRWYLSLKYLYTDLFILIQALARDSVHVDFSLQHGGAKIQPTLLQSFHKNHLNNKHSNIPTNNRVYNIASPIKIKYLKTCLQIFSLYT